jgi:hypothetical protein
MVTRSALIFVLGFTSVRRSVGSAGHSTSAYLLGSEQSDLEIDPVFSRKSGSDVSSAKSNSSGSPSDPKSQEKGRTSSSDHRYDLLGNGKVRASSASLGSSVLNSSGQKTGSGAETSTRGSFVPERSSSIPVKITRFSPPIAGGAHKSPSSIKLLASNDKSSFNNNFSFKNFKLGPSFSSQKDSFNGNAHSFNNNDHVGLRKSNSEFDNSNAATKSGLAESREKTSSKSVRNNQSLASIAGFTDQSASSTTLGRTYHKSSFRYNKSRSENSKFDASFSKQKASFNNSKAIFNKNGNVDHQSASSVVGDSKPATPSVLVKPNPGSETNKSSNNGGMTFNMNSGDETSNLVRLALSAAEQNKNIRIKQTTVMTLNTQKKN